MSSSERPASGIRQITSRRRWKFKLHVEIVGTIRRNLGQEFTIRRMGDADGIKIALPVVYDLESVAAKALFEVR